MPSPAAAGPPARDVACFALVAEHRSFSRAAAELRLSQPAVSQAVARLERALGLRLFERTSREVRLSPAGTALLPYAAALLDQAAAFAAEAARLARPAGPSIRLAYCPLVGGLAAAVARRLARRAPGIDLDLRPAGWTAATAGLAAGTAAAALLTAPFPAGLASTARFRLPLTHLAVPAGSPLGAAAPVRITQLGRYRVLLPGNRPAGGVWAQLEGRLPDRARVPLPGDDLDDPAAALDQVAAGRGLLPVPRLLAQTVLRPDVRFVPLDGGGLVLSYGLVWPQQDPSAALMSLVQTVQEVLRTPAAAAGPAQPGSRPR